MARHYYIVWKNNEEPDIINKKGFTVIAGPGINIEKINNITDDQIISLRIKKENSGISKVINETIVKWSFPLIIFMDIISVAFQALISNKNGSLYLALLSLTTAIFFSEFYREYILINISDTEKFPWKQLCLSPICSLAMSICFATMLLIISKYIHNIPLITKDNIGDILTTLALICFAYDKTKIYYGNPYKF